MTKVSHARRSMGSVVRSAASKREQDFVPNGGGIFNALQTRRPGFPVVMTEIADLRTGGHDQ